MYHITLSRTVFIENSLLLSIAMTLNVLLTFDCFNITIIIGTSLDI